MKSKPAHRDIRMFRPVLFLTVALIAGAGLIACGAEPEPEKKGPIKLADFNWTGNWIDNDLSTILLEEKMGYEVEKITADYTAVWAALSTGEIHAAIEMWPSPSAGPIEEYVVQKASVERLEPMGIIGRNGWYVPAFVVEGDPERGLEPMAPDLRTWEQLNQYKDLFASRETEPKGRFLAGAADWMNFEEERVKALGLDYEVIYAGSEAALNAELISAYEQGNPVLLFHWTPHWIHSMIPTLRIELPEYSEECYQTDYGCDYPDDPAFIAVWPGLKDEYPEVYDFLTKFHLENEDQQLMILWIDSPEYGMDREEAARKWIEMPENEAKWKAWIP